MQRKTTKFSNTAQIIVLETEKYEIPDIITGIINIHNTTIIKHLSNSLQNCTKMR